jgi:heme/copper-type cytochrome/quinol oxidase subunit 3
MAFYLSAVHFAFSFGCYYWQLNKNSKRYFFKKIIMQSNNNSLIKKLVPLFSVFIVVNCLAIILNKSLQSVNINTDVVIGANCILFFVSTLSIAIHKQACDKKNPNAIVRSMMMASLLKLMIVAFSVVIYIFLAKEKRNSYGIFCGMGLYIIYTFIEVRIASKMRQENGKN